MLRSIQLLLPLIAIVSPQSICQTDPALSKCTCQTISVTHIPTLGTGLDLDCSNAQLTEIPKTLPNYTIKLKLNNNLIQKIGPNDLSMIPYLLELSISQNQIVNIASEAFQNLVYLTRLNLSSNQLKSLPSSVFSKLQNLDLLDLNSNQLNFVQRWLLSGLGNLKFLDISNNQITLIHQNALDDAPNLIEIRIHKNKIKTLPNIPFKLEKMYAFNNELVCDCVMSKFLENYGNSLTTIQNPNYVVCNSPPILKGRPIMNVPIEEYLCVDPEITDISEDQNLQTGDLLSLSCSAQGFPPPDITWIAPDGTILSSRKLLYIPSVSQMDAGVYECKASNAQGSSFEHVNVGIRVSDEVETFYYNGLKKDCPRPCHCYKDTIDCRNKNLKVLPIGLSKINWVNNLYLSGNELTSVNSLPKQLRHLTLDDNPLEHLEDYSFQEMKQLMHLSLNNCSLSTIPTTAFTRMEALQTLVLSNNPIKELKMQTLFGLTSLTRLYLERCQLSKIDDAAFLTLYKIKYLYLQGNKLRTISKKWFSSFIENQLIKVQLRDNQWFCDCDMTDFMDMVLNIQPWLEDVTEIDVVKCSQPLDRIHDTIKTAADQLLDQCINTFQFGGQLARPGGDFDDTDELVEDMEVQYDDLLEDGPVGDTDNMVEDSPEVGIPAYPDFSLGRMGDQAAVAVAEVDMPGGADYLEGR